MKTLQHIDKLTESGARLNLDALYKLAPSCFTEVRDDRTGELKHKVDFDALRSLLGDNAVESAEEMYQFTWPGKREARREAARQIDKTLRPVKEDSVDWDTTENLYIEGDNLDALKLLQRSYLGKVKMIYIDPPYNTGNDFVYNDDFSQSAADYDTATGNVDELGIRYRRNTDSNGRFHSDWCTMIYPRLLIARTLLTEDGVIFISIDDNEVENLKKICNEVFGEQNFVGEIIWQTATDNNPRQITIEHEYVLCYAKSKSDLSPWVITSAKAKLIQNYYATELVNIHDFPKAQKQLREWMKKHESELQGVMHYNCVDEKGVYTANTNSSNTKPGGYTYDILHPITGKPCAKPVYGWRWAETTFWNYDKDGDVEWGEDETTQPHIKKRIETATELLKSVYYEDGRASTLLLEALFGKKKIFDNPKAMGLIQRIVDFSCQDKDALILDFFSGSATTAHAVMQLNAEDGGKRKFIMVQLPEETAEDSEARKAGYKNICEIGKERIRRAGKKIKADSPLTTQDIDTGFRVLRIDESNYLDVKRSPADYSQASLDLFADNLRPDRTDMDLLFGCLTAWGLPLSLPMESEEVDGCTVYTVNNGDLVACFSENVTEEVVRFIAQKHPLRIVFRDKCFSEDKQKINLFEQFKQLLDWSEEDAMKNIRVI